MNEVQTFTYHGMQLRALEINGEPWFVAKDVATALEYRMASDMFRGVDEEDKGYAKVRTPGGNQTMLTVNESGLYTAIVRANAERAKPFRRWVTSEVLPAIRKHGAYMTAPTIDALITNPDLVIQLATNLKTEQEKRQLAEQQAAALAPKAEVFDEFLTSEGSYDIGDAAKLLTRAGIPTGQNRLFAYLDHIGWTFKRGGKRKIRQDVLERGLLVYKAQSYRHPVSGELRAAAPQVRVTPKGVERLRLMMLPPVIDVIEKESFC